MDRIQSIRALIEKLLLEMPQYREFAEQCGQNEASQRRLLRSLMNLRPPLPLDGEWIALQDELLQAEREEKGIIDAMMLPTVSGATIALWRGDITRLKADAIVNAANSALLGCFYPCHGCVDNAIHSAAGLQLREECSEIMRRQGHEEPVGQAKITFGYNLPCRYVIHTVGPMVAGAVTELQCRQLESCYRESLKLAKQRKIGSIAFCGISTGEFCFPGEKAAKIAVHAVRDFLQNSQNEIKVIFCVFAERDEAIYRNILDHERNPA